MVNDMDLEITEFAAKIFPFKNLNQKTLNTIFSEIEFTVCEFSKGEKVFSKDNYRKTVGFVIDGECIVEKKRSDGDFLPLNNLSKYSSFGILSLFSSDAEFPTVIKAIKPSRILFINGDDLLEIMSKYPTVSMNVVNFLAGRIAFLNKKIETFSGKSTAEKLASYLIAKYKEQGSDITITRTKLSAEIGVGRASLYRDIDFFAESGLIKTEQKKIIIICPEGLERILK